MFTPAFQCWPSYLGCKYEFLKNSSQVSTLGYLSHSLIAVVVLLLMTLVRQLKLGYFLGNFYLGKGRSTDCSSKVLVLSYFFNSTFFFNQIGTKVSNPIAQEKVSSDLHLLQIISNSNQFFLLGCGG